MLACLIADESDFHRSFAETDVDIYVVGLTGTAFRQRVARLIEGLCAAVRLRGLQAVVLRTPCTITLSLYGGTWGESLPNVQVVLAPFRSTRHLLCTTDIDCTGFGFDGCQLFATPWACQAIAHRRLIARPEKYSIRGEFSSESRLLKYATRGFRVVDLGLRPDIEVPSHDAIRYIASEVQTALLDTAVGQANDGRSMDAIARKFEQSVRATGVNGAHLLLLAGQSPGLQELLLFDVPLLPAGLGDEELLMMLQSCDVPYRQDGYGRLQHKAQIRGRRPRKLTVLCNSNTAGCIVRMAVFDASQERDPDSMAEVRSWYNGIEDKDLIPTAGR